ncbi:unnamed protein product [Arctogadus glacialis]
MMVLTLIDPSVCVRLSSGSDPEVCGRSEDEGFALKPSSMSEPGDKSSPSWTDEAIQNVPFLPQAGPAWPGHRPPLGMAMAAPQAKDQQD